MESSESQVRRAERQPGVPHPCENYGPKACRQHRECNLVSGTRLCRANPGVEERIARRTLRKGGPCAWYVSESAGSSPDPPHGRAGSGSCGMVVISEKKIFIPSHN